MKRTLSLLVALALVFTMIPAVFAADNKENIDLDELTQGMEIDNPTPAEIDKPYTTTWLTFTSEEGGEAHGVHYFEITADEDGNLELTVDANGTVALEGVTANDDGTYPVEAGKKYIVVVTKDAEATEESTWSATYVVEENTDNAENPETAAFDKTYTTEFDVHYYTVTTTKKGSLKLTADENCESIVVQDVAKSEEGTYPVEKNKTYTIIVTKAAEATANPEWKVEFLFNINGTNVVMGNNLTLLFVMRKSNLPDVTGYSAKVTITHYNNGTVTKDNIDIPSSEWEDRAMQGTPCWNIPVGFAAKEMNDTATVVLYKDGVQVSNPKTQSFLEYCKERLVESTNDLFKTLVVDMLNYGAAAQTQFNYNTNNLVNKDLTEAQKALATGSDDYEAYMERTVTKGKELYRNGATITFENEILLKVQTMPRESATAPLVKGKVSFINHLGQSVSEEVVVVPSSGTSIFYLPGLVVADMNQALTLEFYTADGTESAYVIDYSLNAYINDVLNKNPNNYSESMRLLADAFAKFSTSAYAYLHS